MPKARLVWKMGSGTIAINIFYVLLQGFFKSPYLLFIDNYHCIQLDIFRDVGLIDYCQRSTGLYPHGHMDSLLGAQILISHIFSDPHIF